MVTGYMVTGYMVTLTKLLSSDMVNVDLRSDQSYLDWVTINAKPRGQVQRTGGVCQFGGAKDWAPGKYPGAWQFYLYYL